MSPAAVLLLVDDNESDRAAAIRCLEDSELDCRVLCADSLAQALEVHASTESIDLALVDHRLPDGSGVEIFERLPDVPVILVTGAGSEEVARQALRRGAYDYVVKETSGEHLRRLPHIVESTIARLRAERAEADRVAELEIYARAISHDLRAALRHLTRYADHLARAEDAAERDQLRTQVHRSSSRLEELFEGLTAYTQASSCARIELRPVPLAEVLEEVLEDVRPAEQAARVEIGELPTVPGDRARLWQVFRNLLANALKFRGEQAPRIAVSAEPNPGGDWCIRVRDNGIGIPERQRHRVFQLFQQGHPVGAYPGTGVGLTICKRVVELHGGRIWVEGAPGGGTVVAFTLRGHPAGSAASPAR